MLQQDETKPQGIQDDSRSPGGHHTGTLEMTFPHWKDASFWERHLKKMYLLHFHPHLPFLAVERLDSAAENEHHIPESRALDLAIMFIGFGVSQTISSGISLA